jgi:hypothetical protein
LRGVVGRLDSLRLGRRVPKSVRRPESQSTSQVGSEPRTDQIDKRKEEKEDSPSTCFFSVSRTARAVSAACCRLRIVASCSSIA